MEVGGNSDEAVTDEEVTDRASGHMYFVALFKFVINTWTDGRLKARRITTALSNQV